MAQVQKDRILFTIAKYSRATAKRRDMFQSSQSNSSSTFDWQHHTEPTIRLLLEIQKTVAGTYESVRLRIAWCTDRPPACSFPGKAVESVTFEDIELMAFKNSAIKLVFRDTMVGVRYMESTANPQVVTGQDFKRFQITFQNSNDTREFIELIKNVCPCKLSATGPNSSASSTLAAPFRMQQSMFSQQEYSGSQRNQDYLVDSIFSTPFRSIASQNASPHVMSTPMHGHRSIYQNAAQQRIEGQPRISGIYPPSHLAGFSDFDFSQQQFLSSSNINDIQESPSGFSQVPLLNESPATQTSSQKLHDVPPARSANIGRERPRSNAQKLNDALPDPTPPSTSENTQTQNSQVTLVAPAQTNTLPSPTTAPVLSAAAETLKVTPCELFDLSRVDLEKTVAHLIRDESFLQLLEKLDQSWRIKAVVQA